MIFISIGILAYNEEKGIAQTVESVLAQNLQCDLYNKSQPEIRAELVVVPNGCKDRTTQVAREAVSKLQASNPAFDNARVCELEQPGKENAWNTFVNGLSSNDADILVFMDADVRLAHDRVLHNLINTLKNHPECVIAGGNPIKHIEHKKHLNPFDRLSVGATTLRKGMKGIFAGCLYCGYSDFMREMYLPDVLMGEDSFVRAMTVTRGFIQPDDPGLIIRDDDAKVIFEAYTTPSEILRNKTRRMLEASINAILYTKLWAESTAESPAGTLMKQWQAQDPKWSTRLVDETFNARGFWAVPRRFIYDQFLQLKFHRWPRRIKLLPVAIATLPINAYAVYQANRRVAKGEIRNLWDKSV